MITLEQALKTANYHIEAGEAYHWKCFGPTARYLDLAVGPKHFQW